MAKEFPVPQVVFTASDGNLNVRPRIHQPGVAPPPPFNPPRPAIPASSNPNIPFMSFDVGAAQAWSSFSAAVFAASAAGGGSISASGSFEDEPPLLEKLGINTRQSWRKTVSILNPIRLKPDLHEDADLAGPFIFLMAFGLFQLLAGKFDFGIILGAGNSRRGLPLRGLQYAGGEERELGSLPMFELGWIRHAADGDPFGHVSVTHDGLAIFAIAAVFVLWSTKSC